MAHYYKTRDCFQTDQGPCYSTPVHEPDRNHKLLSLQKQIHKQIYFQTFICAHAPMKNVHLLVYIFAIFG